MEDGEEGTPVKNSAQEREKMMDLLRLYRARRWGRKLPFTRFLGYPLLGMAVGPEGALPSFPFLLYLVDGLAVTGILAFSYTFNDYFDFMLEGDSNYMGECIRAGKLTPRSALLISLLPLLLFIPSFLLPLPTLLLLFFFLLLSLLYSLPGVGINRRIRIKFLLSPFSAFLLMLQALLLSGNPTPSGWGLLAIVFLFHCYVNSFHHAEESGGGKILFKLFPLLSFFLSFFLFFLSPFFLLTTFFSFLRFRGKEGNFHVLRSRLFGPPLFSEELLGYSLLGLMGVL